MEHKLTRVLNFFAGPGAGKSTTTAQLFADMKKQNMNVELVTEYAKDLVWEDRMNVLLEDQLYITAKQARRMSRIANKVDYIITDAPLIQGLLYQPHEYFTGFEPLVVEIFNTYDNDNYFIERTTEYDSIGRYQDEAGAREIDEKIMNILVKHGIPFTIIKDLNKTSEIILKKITNKTFFNGKSTNV